jgi:diguanylate cyclase (GGDEF)-like protein
MDCFIPAVTLINRTVLRAVLSTISSTISPSTIANTILNFRLKSRLITSLLFFFAALFTVIASFAANAAHAENHVTIELPQAQQIQFAGYYMAKHKGFFIERGLDVTLSPRNSQRTVLDAVTSGQAEYGVSDSDILIAKANGRDIVAMAAIFQHSLAALLTLKNRGISQIDELDHKRILLLPEQQDIELIALLRKLQINSINVQEQATGRDINYLVNNQFDAFSIKLVNGPYNIVRQSVEPIIFVPKDYGIDFYSDYLFTSTRELTAHPERVEAVLDAVLQGWEYALTHTEETLDIMSQYSNQAAAPEANMRSVLKYQLSTMRDYILPDFIPLGYINQQHFANILQQLVNVDLIAKDSDFRQFIYHKPTNKVDWSIWGGWIKGIIAALLLNGLWLSYLLVVNQKLKREVVERRRAEERVRHAAMHDHLTGLPNRAHLMEKLEQIYPLAEQGKITPVLLFMDLDRFKIVNDQYGHAAGDELLVAVSKRILHLLNKPGHLLSRLGGDEFVILLPDADLDYACELSIQIERTLLQSFALSVCNVSIGISIGYTVFRPHMTADEMLTSADNLMYEVKSEHHQKRKKIVC